MVKLLGLLWILAPLINAAPASGDEFATSAGPLRIRPVYHASLMIEAGGQVIHVDPWSKGDYTGLPSADLILITHSHGDHLDQAIVARLRKAGTVIIGPASVAQKLEGVKILRNGEETQVGPFRIYAVPMYNLKRERSPGVPYHPRGEGNGYVVEYGGFRIYIAGDTEAVPEMKALRNIDVAFLPMNLPFTMTPEEAAEAAKAFRPRVVYPYHYRDADVEAFRKALEGSGIEVRLRKWY